ncbi:hypothetical protein XENOCAPTIV_005727 [Xenoophorus captivus]|uniref:Uncharacterized protein n=1 Tax=Xenoophorus captivus TaxID=1517983 RepID=A0ABV0SFH1_9TELE
MRSLPGKLMDRKQASALIFCSARPTGSSISNDSSLSTGGRTTMVAPRQALPGRMLIQADHRHPGRPITESVSLTKMPKIPTLLNEAEPLKDLVLTLAVSW